MFCKVCVKGDAYLRTILAGVVSEITVNDRTMTNQQWSPGVRTGTIVAAMLFRWISVTRYQVTVQSERKTPRISKKFIALFRHLSLKSYTELYVTSSFRRFSDSNRRQFSHSLKFNIQE